MTSNDSPANDRSGCNLYDFDLRHKQKFHISQPIKLEFDFVQSVGAATTNKKLSLKSDGQRSFE